MGLWDLHQELAIGNTRAAQQHAEAVAEMRADQARDRIDQLEDRVERLLLLNEAIWELAAGKLGLTEDDLVRKVIEVDGRDGAVDGHRVRRARTCSQCGSAVGRERTTCLFCGHAEPPETAFDAV